MIARRVAPVLPHLVAGLALLLGGGAAAPRRAQVKRVRMQVGGYLCDF